MLKSEGHQSTSPFFSTRFDILTDRCCPCPYKNLSLSLSEKNKKIKLSYSLYLISQEYSRNKPGRMQEAGYLGSLTDDIEVRELKMRERTF